MLKQDISCSKYRYETVKGFVCTKTSVLYKDVTIHTKEDEKGVSFAIGNEDVMFILKQEDLMKLLRS